ncbi:type IV secretory system conjugative DNA transfer family protein [Parasphingorhabdus sp. DH2-15]|uniref:type IV secretory system conjugative DNA transfer family protein n=1 Tax=Parasphingorhabdus sp. DH2-15 TaxID=3444112 RepID=UPI003F686DCE
MNMQDNEYYRFGSAQLSGYNSINRAGYFEHRSNSLLVGFHNRKKLLANGMGGILTCAGARSHKLTSQISYNALATGIYLQSALIFDPKGEIAAISQDQTEVGKFCIYFNPAFLHGLPQHRTSPVDHFTRDNPNLNNDVAAFLQNIKPLSGSSNGRFFEVGAQELLKETVLAIVELEGSITLPRIYDVINMIAANSEEWGDFAFCMNQSGNHRLVQFEKWLFESRETQGNGFQGILAEAKQALACLSDPMLRAALSPPFTASLADLCGNQPYHFYIMAPAEYLQYWAPVIKAFFICARHYKAKAPGAPQQTWVIDEAAALGAFPMLTEMYTLGAGIGIRPWAIYQSPAQMKATGKDAEIIIPSSAAVQCYYGIRHIDTAKHVSDILGAQTLEYDDNLRQHQAMLARERAISDMMNGGDPISAGQQYAHYEYAAQHRSKQKRALMDPAEVLGLPDDKMIIKADGLAHCILADRKPYYEQRWMAGTYHPNPYHPPADNVRVKTLFGHKWLDVRTGPVPSRYAHYPQYESGTWSYVEKG